MTNDLHFRVYLECHSLNRRICRSQKRFRTENAERKWQYMLYLCVKENQLDAQFIVVYLIKHLYMFRTYPPSIIRRYTVCLQQLVLIFLFRWLLSWLGSNEIITKTDNCITTTKIIRNVNSYVLQRRGTIFRESKVQRLAINNSKLLVLQ
jgi:hypothetical protein